MISLNPSDFEFFKWRGILKMILKKNLSAIEDFDQALRLNPKDLESSIAKFHCSESHKIN